MMGFAQALTPSYVPWNPIPSYPRCPADGDPIRDRRSVWVLNWFHALLPKNDQFFDLFVAHSRTIVAGAHGLRALLDGGDAVPKYGKAVMDQEHEADAITRDILIAAGRSFITPFDRGAIKHLVTAMDNSIDQMEKTAQSAMLFDIRTFTPEMKEVGDAIVRCALLVEETIPLLQAMSQEAERINKLTEGIQAIENRADDIYYKGVKALYDRHRTDAMGFFTAFRVYGQLEKTIDRFEDIANELQAVVIENV
jgi:uncharacterized protein Yka (UPF0111/DUF47 family)